MQALKNSMQWTHIVSTVLHVNASFEEWVCVCVHVHICGYVNKVVYKMNYVLAFLSVSVHALCILLLSCIYNALVGSNWNMCIILYDMFRKILFSVGGEGGGGALERVLQKYQNKKSIIITSDTV